MTPHIGRLLTLTRLTPKEVVLIYLGSFVAAIIVVGIFYVLLHWSE